MLGGCRPGPVNRHSFGIAGGVGARSAPITVPAPAGWPLSGWRPTLRKRKLRNSRCHEGGKGHRGASRPVPASAFAAWPRSPRRGGESFCKIVLASPSEFPYSTCSHGGVAQLGERLTGSQEVRGSIPLVSTRALNEAPTQVGAFFHIGTQGQRRHHDPPGRQDRKKLRRARPL